VPKSIGPINSGLCEPGGTTADSSAGEDEELVDRGGASAMGAENPVKRDEEQAVRSAVQKRADLERLCCSVVPAQRPRD